MYDIILYPLLAKARLIMVSLEAYRALIGLFSSRSRGGSIGEKRGHAPRAHVLSDEGNIFLKCMVFILLILIIPVALVGIQGGGSGAAAQQVPPSPPSTWGLSLPGNDGPSPRGVVEPSPRGGCERSPRGVIGPSPRGGCK